MNTALLISGIVLAAVGAAWNVAEIALSRRRIRGKTEDTLGEMVRQKEVTMDGIKQMTERIAARESLRASAPYLPMLAGLLLVILSLAI